MRKLWFFSITLAALILMLLAHLDAQGRGGRGQGPGPQAPGSPQEGQGRVAYINPGSPTLSDAESEGPVPRLVLCFLLRSRGQ